MKSITETLENLFSEASIKAFPNLENTLTEITPSTNPKFGHYQYNSAMKLSKALKNGWNKPFPLVWLFSLLMAELFFFLSLIFGFFFLIFLLFFFFPLFPLPITSPWLVIIWTDFSILCNTCNISRFNLKD